MNVEQVSNGTPHVSFHCRTVSLENATESAEVRRYSEWQRYGRTGSQRPPRRRLGTGQGIRGMNLKYAIYSMLRWPDSIAGMETGYGLDGPGIESRWGRDFPALGPTQPPVQWVPGLSLG